MSQCLITFTAWCPFPATAAAHTPLCRGHVCMQVSRHDCEMCQVLHNSPTAAAAAASKARLANGPKGHGCCCCCNHLCAAFCCLRSTPASSSRFFLPRRCVPSCKHIAQHSTARQSTARRAAMQQVTAIQSGTDILGVSCYQALTCCCPVPCTRACPHKHWLCWVQHHNLQRRENGARCTPTTTTSGTACSCVWQPLSPALLLCTATQQNSPA